MSILEQVGELRWAATYGAALYRAHPHGSIAHQVTRSLVLLGYDDDAVGWLRLALSGGVPAGALPGRSGPRRPARAGRRDRAPRGGRHAVLTFRRLAATTPSGPPRPNRRGPARNPLTRLRASATIPPAVPWLRGATASCSMHDDTRGCCMRRPLTPFVLALALTGMPLAGVGAQVAHAAAPAGSRLISASGSGGIKTVAKGTGCVPAARVPASVRAGGGRGHARPTAGTGLVVAGQPPPLVAVRPG